MQVRLDPPRVVVKLQHTAAEQPQDGRAEFVNRTVGQLLRLCQHFVRSGRGRTHQRRTKGCRVGGDIGVEIGQHSACKRRQPGGDAIQHPRDRWQRRNQVENVFAVFRDVGQLGHDLRQTVRLVCIGQEGFNVIQRVQQGLHCSPVGGRAGQIVDGVPRLVDQRGNLGLQCINLRLKRIAHIVQQLARQTNEFGNGQIGQF